MTVARALEDDPGDFRVWVLGTNVAQSDYDDLGGVLGEGDVRNVCVGRNDGEDGRDFEDATGEQRDVV